MKNKKKIIIAVAAVVAIIAVIILLCIGRGGKKAELSEDVPEETAETEPEGNQEAYSPTIYYPGDENYPTEYEANNLVLEDVYDGDNMLTADMKCIPDIMSPSIIRSNLRSLEFENEDGTLLNFIVGGPNIVINGYAVPEGSFYAQSDLTYGRDAGTKVEFTRYWIRGGALLNAGLSPVSGGSFTTPAECALINGDNYLVPMSAVEMDITFSCTKYDEKTNTYYFNAVNNGPYGGTSDIFYEYRNGTRLKVFPLKYVSDEVLEKARASLITYISGSDAYSYVSHSDFNDYWTFYELSRNDLRQKLNNEYNKNYPMLDFDGDPEFKTEEYWQALDPEMWALGVGLTPAQ